MPGLVESAEEIPSVKDKLSSPPQSIGIKMVGKDTRITLNFDSMRLEDILMAVSRQSGVNFITSAEIRDLKFRAYLKNITISEALDALLMSQGLVYEQFPESNIYVVKKRTETMPRVLTRVFHLKYIQIAGDTKSSAGTMKKSGFSFINTSGTTSQDAGGDDQKSSQSSIINVVQSVLSENGRLQIDPYTNSLIVTDIPERFSQIVLLINKLDIMTPQIYIESEIVEINTDEIKKVGVKYGLSDGTLAKLVGPARVLQLPTSSKNRLFPNPTHLEDATVGEISDYGYDPTTGVNFGILSFLEFQAVLKAIELSGTGKFLARPKVITLNNKPAIISVTAETAVGIESASLISQSGLLVSAAERYTTGITLAVTPQVNDDEYITLSIEPTISRPRSSEFFPGQFVDPQSAMLTSTVRVKTGETIMIGGLMTNDEQKDMRKVPFLGHIPILGRLFSYEETSNIKKDLMIFITPRIMNNEQ